MLLNSVSGLWLTLGGFGFFIFVHLLGALALIVALTVADFLWTMRAPHQCSVSSPQPPGPKGRTRAHRPGFLRQPAMAGVHR